MIDEIFSVGDETQTTLNFMSTCVFICLHMSTVYTILSTGNPEQQLGSYSAWFKDGTPRWPFHGEDPTTIPS